MNRHDYYESLKALARQERATHGLLTPRVLLSDLRRIYKHYGIQIDLWPHKLKSLRGAYFNDALGPSVMLAKSLPEEPRIFTMAHELKHHLVDRDLALSYCDPSNQNEPIEIGAEIFAAELIFPEQDFAAALTQMGVQRDGCTPEMLVWLKSQTRTTLSYASLAKLAVYTRFSPPEFFKSVKWKKLEEKLLGVPFYKRVARSGT